VRGGGSGRRLKFAWIESGSAGRGDSDPESERDEG